MFPRQKRLTKELDIQAVFKSRKSAFSKYLGLKTKTNSLDHNRYTVIIGKKVAKLAVTRNLVKRRVRTSLREFETDTKQGYDIIILCLKGAKDLNSLEINKNIKYILKKTELIN